MPKAHLLVDSRAELDNRLGPALRESSGTENESDWNLNYFEQILELLQSVNTTEVLNCQCHIVTAILFMRLGELQCQSMSPYCGGTLRC